MKKTIQFVLIFSALLPVGCQRNSAVIARIGSEKITIDEFMGELSSAPEDYAEYLATPAGRSRFVNVLVKQKLMIAAARDLRIDATKQYRQLVTEYKRELDRQLAEYTQDLLIQEYYQRLKGSMLEVTAQEIEAFFKSNEALYQKPVTITLRYVFSPDETALRAAHQKLAAGASFNAVAADVGGAFSDSDEHSTFTLTQPGMLSPEIEAAARTLAVGALSDIIASEGGFYVLKKTAQVQAQPITFEEARGTIEQVIEKQKFDVYIEELKKKYPVEVSTELVESYARKYMIQQLKNAQ